MKQSAFPRTYLHSSWSILLHTVWLIIRPHKSQDMWHKGDCKQSNRLLPVALCPVVLFTPITVTHNSACDRDECSFMSVMAVALLVFPMANTCPSINQPVNESIHQSFNQPINHIINNKKFPCDSVNINPRLWLLCKRKAAVGNIRKRHPIR